MSTKKYFVLCLQGPESRIDEAHRRQIKTMQVQHSPPPVGHTPPAIMIPSAPKKEVHIEACWRQGSQWDIPDPQEMLNVLMDTGITYTVHTADAGGLGIIWDRESTRIIGFAEECKIPVDDRTKLVNQMVIIIKGERVTHPASVPGLVADEKQVEITCASPLREAQVEQLIHPIRFKATRPSAVRFVVNLPEDQARELVKAMNTKDMQIGLDSRYVETFTWIEEDVNQPTTFAINVPTDGQPNKASERATAFMWAIAEKTGKPLALAPGRWFATNRDWLPRNRYFHITGIAPEEATRILVLPDVAKGMGQGGISAYDNRGILLRTAGNSATIVIPIG
eukprot:gene9880-18033_t